MNERILELAIKSGIAYQSKQQDYETNNGFTVIPSKDSLEKFAELIVQECILTIQMGISRDGTQTEKFIRSVKHIKDIKEHFGVEE